LKGKIINSEALLEWQNKCKKQIDHFTIQRSFNGTSFTDVTEVKSDNDIIIYNVAENLSGYTTTTIYYRIFRLLQMKKNISFL